MCPSCNWNRNHDPAVHGALCFNGHPLAVVGVYTAGQHGQRRCRACMGAASKKYDEANREKRRAQWKAWYARERSPSKPKREVLVAGLPGAVRHSGPGDIDS